MRSQLSELGNGNHRCNHHRLAMRNLALVGHETLGAAGAPAPIEALTVDAVAGSVYVAGPEPPAGGEDARHESGAPVRLWLWQLASAADRAADTRIQPTRIVLPAPPTRLGGDNGPPHSTQLHTPRERDAQVVSLQFLQDGGSLASYDRALCMVTAGGDIVLTPLPEQTGEAPALAPDVVGTIEQGIAAAAWSPDEEFLAVVTLPSRVAKDDGSLSWIGEKVLVMTREFEVVKEQALATDDFGQGALCPRPRRASTTDHSFVQTSRSTSDGVPRRHNFTDQKAKPQLRRRQHTRPSSKLWETSAILAAHTYPTTMAGPVSAGKAILHSLPFPTSSYRPQRLPPAQHFSRRRGTTVWCAYSRERACWPRPATSQSVD